MKKSFLICFLFLFLSVAGVVNVSCQDRNFSIVDKCLERRTQFESMSYDMELEYKIFSREDTLKQLAKVELVRIQDDSLFGGLCSIDLDSIWFGYNGTNIMRGVPQTGTIEMANAVQNPSHYIKSTWVDNFIDYGFLRPNHSLQDYLHDQTSESRFLDTLIGEWPCLGIFFKLADQEGIYDQTIFLAIDTIEYYFRCKMYSAYFQGNQQYTSWKYHQIQYGHKLNIDKLDKANLTKFTNIVQVEIDTSEVTSNISFDFSLLTGNLLTKDEVFKITNVYAHFIILDFWYTSCYPCIKSIPAVNEIYHTYKDKDIAVYGINPLDDAQKDKTRIDKFLKNNPMGYETIMVDREIGSVVCAEGYPTFIILDQKYNVVYKETGYKENLFQEVSAFLDEALKQTK